MNVYLAGASSFYMIEEQFKNNSSLLRCSIGRKETSTVRREMLGPLLNPCRKFPMYALESFAHIDTSKPLDTSVYDGFMLDSGAFTFMTNPKSHLNWDDYIERYADFIKRNNIELFYELDIDNVVGYEQVKEYRKRLESLVGRQCIPVYHDNRGPDEFIKMCQEYNYVAFGGLVCGMKQNRKNYEKIFPWFIQVAHKNKARIHALGFTSANNLKKYSFDSVDSSSWAAGARYGFVNRFDGQSVQQIHPKNGQQLIDTNLVRFYSYIEWRKFQKYAKTNL